MTAKSTTRRPQRQQSKTVHIAHPSTNLFTPRSRDRLAGNILLLASMAADQATILIELSAPLGYIVNPEGDVFAMIKRDRHSECWPVRSKEFTEWLSQSFYRETEKGCNRNALSDAINTIEARAKNQCKERKPVFLRIANFGDRIYIDLCDERWRVIEVRAAGWRVLDKPPVHFTRKRGMLPLPEPDVTDQGSCPLLLTGIYRMKRFLNINEEVFPLVVGWLLAALGGATPYPVIVLQGEQGTGKSTTSRIIQSLVDPSTAPLRSSPNEVLDLLVSAVNNHVKDLDAARAVVSKLIG
jgi:hypothetical protein